MFKLGEGRPFIGVMGECLEQVIPFRHFALSTDDSSHSSFLVPSETPESEWKQEATSRCPVRLS